MKAFSVLIILSCLSACLFAQTENRIEKGIIVAGGSISLDLSRSKQTYPGISQDVKFVSSFTFLPTLDLKYLLTDHLAVGLITEDSFSFSKIHENSTTDSDSDNITEFFLGPVIRYYIKSGFFLISSAQIGGYERTARQRKYLLNTGLGYSLFVGKNAAIEPILKYNHFYSKYTKLISHIEKRNGIELSVGLQIALLNSKKINK